ncbi:hypothetical protein MHB56_23475 [Paenibacillus sp. FSL H8-0315]|uniref:hypothetical protein n=1 Tax=Paenibacillus sp. FSL H8-0315 TaxID=2921384 RepID=UPI0030F5E0B8
MSASKADRSSMQRVLERLHQKLTAAVCRVLERLHQKLTAAVCRVLERLHQKLTAAVCKVLECLQKGGDPYGSPPFYAEAKFGIR